MSPGRIQWRSVISRYGLLLAFLLMVAALSMLSDYFLTRSNILNVLRQISVNALLAFGQTVVIIAAGIDLSVGSLLAYTGALAAGLAKGA